MRTWSLLLALTLFASTGRAQPAAGSWAEITSAPRSGSGNRIDDGFFISPDTGFVVVGGIVGSTYVAYAYATEDGGVTWERRGVLPVSARSIGFASARVGWVGSVGGADRKLFETRDGGRTFTNVSDRVGGATVRGVCGLSVVSERVVYGAGWCCGGGAVILKTDDGGGTWNATSLDSLAAFLIDVRFTDEDRGITVGAGRDGRAIVVGTDDGGRTWALRHASDNARDWTAWKISFPTPDTGYVSIEHADVGDLRGKVLRTTDGGRTWADVEIPGGSRLQGLGFATGTLGWTSGRGVRSETRDGGRTWSRYTGALDGTINRFRMFGDTLGYAFGHRIYKYRNAPSTASESDGPGLYAATLTVYPNPSSGQISFAFDLLTPGPAELAVFDVAGRQIATVERGTFPAGTHVVRWGGDGGVALPSGTYFYRLTTAAGVDAGPFIWVRR